MIILLFQLISRTSGASFYPSDNFPFRQALVIMISLSGLQKQKSARLAKTQISAFVIVFILVFIPLPVCDCSQIRISPKTPAQSRLHRSGSGESDPMQCRKNDGIGSNH